MPVFLVIAGCGGGSSSSSVTAAGTSSSTTQVTSSLTTGSVSSSRLSTTTTSHSAGTAPPGNTQSARIPATFMLGAGGTLTPPTISFPAFIATEVTVISTDGASHQLVIETPTPHTLAVASHARASVLIGGLKAGRYPIRIDGATRGALVVGGEPGP